ncbi:PREDICTED: F-box protein At1g53790 isoform X2 [Camelina sativa]|uniref:F-box protein At1g53790 isoform X2 n=1 Tax=Camelina sativa TaxID=90675 RepID=A0ABM0X167_CAMSA|nr:PREDICTED: F-box protein At1g53790 isoform X2 [Camelina sativa]XP_010479101.1 PREDICTED: F-box protein At1g53790 isoform X2 [Camelina sativa]
MAMKIIQECPNSVVVREIPTDLLMDIFSRVPAKSVARFCCVSKLWESIICHPDFAEFYFTMSSCTTTPPRRPPLLFFTLEDDGKLFFFSSPHTPTQKDPHHENKASLVSTRYHVHRKNTPTNYASDVGSPLCGFICHRDRGSPDTIVICNPATGQSVTLPKVKLKGINTDTRPFLGYDPIGKQLKVLCIKFDMIPNPCYEHQVLTLEDNGKRLWRTVQCKPHYPKSDGICIDGTLYYTAGFSPGTRVSIIVCFDVRSEKFSSINIDECMLMTYCTLINYNGKLGALQFTSFLRERLGFWVLQDAEKHIWSRDFYMLPPLPKNKFERTELAIVGMTVGGEVVLAPYCLVDEFYLYYFNLECKSLKQVHIQGFEMFKNMRVYTSLEYAENLKLMTEYDTGVDTFTPERRLFQVKSATKASKDKAHLVKGKEASSNTLHFVLF